MHCRIFLTTTLIFLSLNFSARAEFSENASALELMENGLQATEALADFIVDHPCELGIKSGFQSICEKPLKASELRAFKQILRNLENWRVQTFEVIFPAYDVLEGQRAEIQLGDRLSVVPAKKFDWFTFEREPYLSVTYNPLEDASQEFVQKVRITTAATLQLYDSFFKIARLLAHAQKLKSIIQNDMPEEGRFLSRTYSLAMNRKLIDQVEYALRFLRQEKKLRGTTPLTESESFFEQFVQKSVVGAQLLKDSQAFKIRSFFFLTGQVVETQFIDDIETIVTSLSGLFGNATGQVQFRDGKMKSLTKNTELMKLMKASFQPLDVFLEKTPFRLTDKFIPGYYGHVAIWLGSFADLDPLRIEYQGKEIPFLSHPDVLPHLGKIMAGQSVNEALREPGVTLNTFEHFLDIDDLLVLRPNPMSDKERIEHLLRAFQQIGKPYDFGFDVETERAIVCSELVYSVFSDQEWPVSKSFGRYTMSPDHVARKAVAGAFTPLIMYRDGQKIIGGMEAQLKEVLDLVGTSFFLD